MRKFLFACAAFILTVSTTSAARAADDAGSDMRLGYRVVAPAGFRTYCDQTPSDCTSPSTVAPAPRMTIDGDVRGVSNSLWPSAFAQIRAGSDYPTGTILEAYTPQGVRGGQRNQGVRTELALSVAAIPVPRLPSARGPEYQIPAPSTPTHITLDAATGRTLQQVNASINARIRPAKDEVLYGGKDVWGARTGSDGVLYGDCEDYVLAKRTSLIAHGVPASALSIALAHTGDRQTHAVLVVATDKGDYILDNLSFWVRPWAEVPYEWIMRQNHGDAADWRTILVTDKVPQTPARIASAWRY